MVAGEKMTLPQSAHFAHAGLASSRSASQMHRISQRKLRSLFAKGSIQLQKIDARTDIKQKEKAKLRAAVLKRAKRKASAVHAVAVFPSVAASATQCVDRLAQTLMQKIVEGCVDITLLRRRRGISSSDVAYVANALEVPGSFESSVTDELSLLPNCLLGRTKRSAPAKGGVKPSDEAAGIAAAHSQTPAPQEPEPEPEPEPESQSEGNVMAEPAATDPDATDED
jgi:histone H3/H4